jgi:hypothetical protein
MKKNVSRKRLIEIIKKRAPVETVELFDEFVAHATEYNSASGLYNQEAEDIISQIFLDRKHILVYGRMFVFIYTDKNPQGQMFLVIEIFIKKSFWASIIRCCAAEESYYFYQKIKGV